jgi:hypothetical protein
MTNVYYNSNGDPVFLSFGASAKIRAQFAAVGAGFDGVAAALAALAAPTQPLLPINVNPDFIFDQVNEGALYTVSAGTVHLMDGWVGGASGAGAFKVRRVADPDNAALKCAEITCTTADATIGASDYALLTSNVEGYDIAWAGFGTSAVKTLTVRFAFKTSVVGTYGVTFADTAFSRMYVSAISVVDTNEHEYSVTITADSSGTWDHTTGIGLRLYITLAAGSTYHATAGSWVTATALTTSAQVNFLSNTSNIAYLKRVHLVPGSVVLPYAPANVEAQLAKCQRYFAKTFDQGVAVAQGLALFEGALGGYVVNPNAIFSWDFATTMRSLPAVTFYSVGAPNANFFNIDKGLASNTGTQLALGHRSMKIQVAKAGSDDVGDLVEAHATADARLLT